TLYRALADEAGASLVAVRAAGSDGVEVRVAGRNGGRWVPVLSRMLGTQADLSQWYARSAKIPGLEGLATRVRGVYAPGYASAWEACAHAIVFQQISIHAAGSIMRRCVEALGDPIEIAPGELCYPFPEPARWLEAPDERLIAAGLSTNKRAHLRSVAQAF